MRWTAIVVLGLVGCVETAVDETSRSVCGESSVHCWAQVEAMAIDSAALARSGDGAELWLGAADRSGTCAPADGAGLLIRWAGWAIGTTAVGQGVGAVLVESDGTERVATAGQVNVDSADDVCASGGYRLEFDSGGLAEGTFLALVCE